ncbi:MAG: hypothetical protein KME23_18410 [Goleter apudmare HA4340-LM2]|jgi:hypothetical protein|nr:hypothetical protein [Goleter apudmare HA4340-LM2]
MSADFLTTLAARTLGLTPVIQPAIASLFAPQSPIGSDYLEECRGVENFDIHDDNSFTANSSSLSSPLVSSGNSLGAISRLPYSQILVAIPDTELGQQEQVNRSLSSPTNYQPVPIQSIPETVVSPPQPLLNSVTSKQQSDNQENPSNSEVDDVTKRLASSQIVDSEIEPVTPQPLSAQNAMSNDKTHSIYTQSMDLLHQTEDGELGNANSQANVPLVEPLTNNINLKLSIDSQSAIANPDTQLSFTHKQSNMIPPPAIPDQIQRQVDAATPLPSQSLTSPNLPWERSESVTPRVEPLINQIDLQPQAPNQQHFDSQSQEFPNSKETEIFTSTMEVLQPESTASPPSIVPINAVTPVVSPLENQQPFVSPRQENLGTAQITPTVESSQSRISAPSVFSPLENQQPFVSQPQENSGNSGIIPTVESSQSQVSAIPVVSPLENQQTFVSPRQENSGTVQITRTRVDSIATNSAFQTLESQTVQRTTDNTSSSQRQIAQQTSQVSAAIPRLTTVAAEQQFSQQPQANRTVSTPTVVTSLVDKRRFGSAESSQAWEFPARLPSENFTHENTPKIKPLVVMSQQRSPDLENETQLNNKRETSPVLPLTVQVTIGRIEVRSSPTPTAPKANNKSTPRQPSVSLQDYLKQRQGGKP